MVCGAGTHQAYAKIIGEGGNGEGEKGEKFLSHIIFINNVFIVKEIHSAI